MTRPRTTETVTLSPRLDARIRHYWSHRAAGFGQVRRQELHSDKAERWWAEIAPHLPAPDGNTPLRVLDVGTGAGFLAILLARHGCEATGVDSCLPMLDEARALARQEGRSVTFLPMDAQRLDFPDASFDCIVARNVTWTLVDPYAAYREWWRVLRKGRQPAQFRCRLWGRRLHRTGRDGGTARPCRHCARPAARRRAHPAGTAAQPGMPSAVGQGNAGTHRLCRLHLRPRTQRPHLCRTGQLVQSCAHVRPAGRETLLTEWTARRPPPVCRLFGSHMTVATFDAARREGYCPPRYERMALPYGTADGCRAPSHPFCRKEGSHGRNQDPPHGPVVLLSALLGGRFVVFDGPLIAKDESANICMMAMNAIFPFVYAARKGVINHGPFQCPDCADKVEFRIERA